VQIGIPLRIAVLYINRKQVVLINPEITARSTRFLEYPEICMSSNPVVAKITRPSWVEVSYLNELGRKRIWDEKDDLILNRVFQHEIDHLDGILNIDLARPGDLIFDADPDFFKNAVFEEKEMGL
jgi:peptide deformylase